MPRYEVTGPDGTRYEMTAPDDAAVAEAARAYFSQQPAPAAQRRPKLVDFEGIRHEFPDDVTDAEIAEALNEMYPANAASDAARRQAAGATPAVPASATTPRSAGPQAAATDPWAAFPDTPDLAIAPTAAAPWAKYGPASAAPAAGAADDPWRDFPDAPNAAAPAEAEPSLVDQIMSFAKPAGRVADFAARGVAEGVANIAGLPQAVAGLQRDVAQWGLGKLGAPQGVIDASAVAFPLAKLAPSAEGMRAALDAGNAALPEAVQPDTTPNSLAERLTRRVGQEVGAAAVPVTGALTAASRLGVSGARELPGLARMFVEPAAVNAGRFAAKEGTVAAAAGVGAGTANEIFDPSTTAGQVADILGALTGAGALGVAGHVGPKIGEVFNALRRSPNYVDDVVRENVTDTIIRAAGLDGAGEPVDTTSLVETIMGGKRVSDTVPGFQESVADRTGNPGLAALEYGRQSGPNSGTFAQRRGENTAAIDSAMNRNAPDGNPGALRSELELERDRRLADADVQTANARDAFDRSTSSLRSTMTGEARGADVRAALEGASDRAKEMVRQAWAPLNEAGDTLDVSPLASRFGEIGDSLSTAERNRFQPAEAAIPGQLAADGEQPLREVTGLRSALTDAAREASTAGRANEARIIGQHIEALDGYLDTSIPADLRDQYAAARTARRDYADRFERPQTAIAQTLDRQQGQYRQPDSGVTGKFVQVDEGRIADFEALMREGGQDVRVQGAVRDQILADVRDRGLLEQPQRLDEYLSRYGTVFGRFPGLGSELGSAGALRRNLAGAETAQLDLLREIGPQGRGTVARYLQYGDENADRAMKAVIAAKEPGRAADELLTFVNDDPNAVLGARRTFWDLLQKTARSRGETTATMDGVQPWMPKALQGFLDDPRASAVAERLWRDQPEHLENIREITAAIQNVDVRSRAKAPNTSGTAQGVNPVLTPETLQSRWYAYRSGRISGSFLLTSIAAVTGRRAVARAQTDAISRMLDEALLNPDAAATLLMQNNPANRAALARKAKGWLGNEAATFLNLMSGDDEDDPVKAAVMGR